MEISKMTPEQSANLLLQEQGFIVIGGVNVRPKKRGDIIPSVDFGDRRLSHPVVVIGESNAEEWHRQRALMGWGEDYVPEGSLFYRVVAE